SFWVLALAGIAILSWHAWGWVARQPRALAIEISTLLVLAAFALFPPCWRAISAARRRHRARGLLPHRHPGLAITLLSLGALFGILFPLWLVIALCAYPIDSAV